MIAGDRTSHGTFASGNHAGRATRFRPGQSGNRHGRPRGIESWRRELADGDSLDLLIAATDPDNHANHRVAALSILIKPGAADLSPKHRRAIQEAIAEQAVRR